MPDRRDLLGWHWSEADPNAAVNQEGGADGDDGIGRLADLVRPVEEVLHREKELTCGDLGDGDGPPEHEVHDEEVTELQRVEVVLELISHIAPLDIEIHECGVSVAELHAELMLRD